MSCFCVRDVKNINIPKFIKRICSYSFSDSSIEHVTIPTEVRTIEKEKFNECQQLQTIEFEQDSKLQIIDYSAFGRSSIESIIIPREVTRIGDSAFSSCSKLLRIKFEKNSKLQIIDNFAFYGSSIESIKISSEVQKIGTNAFWSCFFGRQLQIMEIGENSKLKIISHKLFLREFYDLIIVMIPVSLKDKIIVI